MTYVGRMEGKKRSERVAEGLYSGQGSVMRAFVGGWGANATFSSHELMRSAFMFQSVPTTLRTCVECLQGSHSSNCTMIVLQLSGLRARS